MKFSVLILSLTFTITLQAQEKRYPARKMFSIQKDYFGDSDFKRYSKNSELQDQGELSQERLKINALVPFYTKGQFTATAALSYTRENLSYYRKEGSGLFQKNEVKTNDFDAALSGMYTTTLFHKPMINTATVVLGSSNFFNPKKMTGLLSTAIILKASAVTVSSFGIVVNIDKASLVPFFPVFSYWHKLENSLWEFDLVLPQKVMFRRSGVWNGWLSAGVELTSNSFFVKQAAEGSYPAGNYEWVANDILTNVNYEKFIGKKLILGLKGGYRNTLTNRLIKVNESSNKYRSRTNLAAPFLSLNAGFAIN